MDMRICTWNVKSLYLSGLLTRVAREVAKHKLNLVGVEGVRWEKEGTLSAGDYIFSVEEETKIINGEQVFLYTTE
jgi:hypothetical protein